MVRPGAPVLMLILSVVDVLVIGGVELECPVALLLGVEDEGAQRPVLPDLAEQPCDSVREGGGATGVLRVGLPAHRDSVPFP